MTSVQDDFCVGVEIEIIAKSIKVYHPFIKEVYYEKLAECLRRHDTEAKADVPNSRYRKHDEHYDKWWITKDGSLGNPPRPEVPLEAVSPIMNTWEDWEHQVEVFWSAFGYVFREPEPSPLCGSHIHISPQRRDKRFSLDELRYIAFGICRFESFVTQLLPRERRRNKYCRHNSARLTADEYSKRGMPHNSFLLWQHVKRQKSTQSLRNWMQYNLDSKKDRYVLWNFDNVLPERSGTIEFRGGPGLRGPALTKRWISFVVAFIHLCLDMRGGRHGDKWELEGLRMRSFWQYVLSSASDCAVSCHLPDDWRVMAELNSDDSDEDHSDSDADSDCDSSSDQTDSNSIASKSGSDSYDENSASDQTDISSVASKSDLEYSDSDYSDGEYENLMAELRAERKRKKCVIL